MALQRIDFEIHKVIGLEVQLTTTMIRIALLPGLSCAQMITDKLDLTLGLTDRVWAKERSFTGLGPVQRGSALPPVQSLERCHAEAGLIAVVVGELGKWQALLPILPVGKNTGTEHIFNTWLTRSV